MEESVAKRKMLRSILSSRALRDEANGERIKKIIEQIDANRYTLTEVLSYSSHVYFLSLRNDSEKYVVKVRVLDRLLKLGKEALAFQILSNKITVPQLVWYGVTDQYEVAVYEKVEGVKRRGGFLDDNKIKSIWKLILTIQNTLFASTDLLHLAVENSKTYATEIRRYTLKYVGKDIPAHALQQLNAELERQVFKDSITVFSDRGPVNWVIGKSDIIPIDFDLLLLEPRLADFIQFIDHHELHVIYDREILIKKCLAFLSENNVYFTEADFHWHAVYRNLTQGAVFYIVDKTISLYHYQKALASLCTLHESVLKKEIEKILREVAWI